MKYTTLAEFLLVGGLFIGAQAMQDFHLYSSGEGVETFAPPVVVTARSEVLLEQSRSKVEEIIRNLESAQGDMNAYPLDSILKMEPHTEEELEEEEEPTQEEESPQFSTWYQGKEPASATASPVGAEYFADAAIIGDSRSQGLMSYGDLGGGANMTGLGLSVYNVWDKAFVETSNGKLTLRQALSNQQYTKVYVALGINSVGYPSRETFYQKYTNLIQEIRSMQPNAVIYVQNIMPVNEAAMKSRGTYDIFNNQVIAEFNGYIHQVATENGLVYLDTYQYFLDDNGQLPTEASGDGLHLNSTYCKKWADYLRWHTVPTSGLTASSSSQGSSAGTASSGWTAPAQQVEEVAWVEESVPTLPAESQVPEVVSVPESVTVSPEEATPQGELPSKEAETLPLESWDSSQEEMIGESASHIHQLGEIDP